VGGWRLIEVVGRVKRRFIITCTCIVAISGAVKICVGRERKVRQRSLVGFGDPSQGKIVLKEYPGEGITLVYYGQVQLR
jgi:hypothetical protein